MTETSEISTSNIAAENKLCWFHYVCIRVSTLGRFSFADGSLSDTALGTQHNMGGSRRVKMSGGTTGKMATSMGKKSSSTSQLSATGERPGGNATACALLI